MKKIVSFCMLLAFSLSAGAQVYDISTGIVNGSGTSISAGSNDDTWQVYDPLGSLVTPKVCNPLTGTWASTGCSGWITTALSGTQPASTTAGDYYFVTYINITSICDITSAYLNLNSIAADNTVPTVYVNGNPYSTGIPNNSNNNYSSISTGISLNVAADLGVGLNEIMIYVENINNAVGLTLCGNLTVNKYTLSPALTINSIGCNGYVAATALGTTGPGTSFSWQMDECDAAGVLTFGGYSYNSGSFSGTPTNHLYPAVTCGKYYRVQLTTATSCKSASTSQVIFVPCPPTVNLGADVTICHGSCTNIGITSFRNGTYSWASSAGAMAQTTNQVSVCPTTTTTYTITATNTNTGCSATDAITVTVLPNDPSFGVTTVTTNPSYYTVHATPTITSWPGLTGFGYAWFVEDMVSGSPIYTINNPSSWWTLSTDFVGFDPAVFTYSGTVSSLASTTTPALGRFLYNRTYRITRGTWSDQCGWQQFSTYLTLTKALNGDPVIYVVEDPNAPDMSYLMNSNIQQSATDKVEQFAVYPNPGKGVFTIEAGNSTTATIEVFDAQGRKVQEVQQTGFKFAVDLTGFSKGIYMINIMSEGKLTSKKIVLE